MHSETNSSIANRAGKFTFKPLSQAHFPLLLKWLESPHVKAWWDSDIHWTADTVAEKYTQIAAGRYKTIQGIKSIQAWIILLEERPVGYLQCYNPRDFEPIELFKGLTQHLGGVDIFIGEADCLGQGIGTLALKIFFKNSCKGCYDQVLVDPHPDNKAAICTYEKAGFERLQMEPSGKRLWMVKHLKQPK